MKTIPLTKGRVAIVDDCMYKPLMAMGKWQFDGRYANRNSSRKEPPRHKVYMHRAVMELAGYDITDIGVDHWNRNKLDNQLDNLRLGNQSQNMANSGGHARNTSGFKGVSWNKDRGMWAAKLRVHPRRLTLGYFDDPRDAARAYDKAAMLHFGEFARLNFPDAAVCRQL